MYLTNTILQTICMNIYKQVEQNNELILLEIRY